jgi:hypothetical protein
MAFVTVGDKVCVVRADNVGAALLALHGEPKQGMQVKANIEYDLRSAAEVAATEEFDKAGLYH